MAVESSIFWVTAFLTTVIWFFASLITTRNLRIAAYLGISIGAWTIFISAIASTAEIWILEIIGLIGVVGINWYFLKSPMRIVINFVLAFVIALVLGLTFIGIIIVGLGGWVG